MSMTEAERVAYCVQRWPWLLRQLRRGAARAAVAMDHAETVRAERLLRSMSERGRNGWYNETRQALGEARTLCALLLPHVPQLEVVREELGKV